MFSTSSALDQIKQELATVSPEHFAFVKQNINGRIPHHHIEVLYVLRNLMGESCRTYVEIGTHNGGSMGLVLRHPSPCFCLGVDMFQKVLEIPRYRYFAADNLSREKTETNLARVNKWKHSWFLVEGNSRDETTIRMVKILAPKIDLLFIDGDHSYPAVKNDWENYSPLVRSEGFVVFDDYAPSHHEIRKFVNELDEPDWVKIGAVPNEYIMRKK